MFSPGGGVRFGADRCKCSSSHAGLCCVSTSDGAIYEQQFWVVNGIPKWHFLGGRRAVFILVLGVKLPPWCSKGRVLDSGGCGDCPSPRQTLPLCRQTHPALVPCSVFSQVSFLPVLKWRRNHGSWISRLMFFAVCWKLIYCSLESISLYNVN